MRARALAVALAVTTQLSASIVASGHGPVFGAATPTLGRGGWSFDQAWMGRRDRGGESDQMLRSMIGFGLTEDLQITASLPIELSRSGRMPMGRMTATMSGNRDVEVLAGWRFHRRAVGEGGRFESTAYVGGTVPLESSRDGLRTAPAASVSASTGYASRAHYVWLGAGHQIPGADAGDRMGAVTSYSVVYGYRPSVLRLDYPKPDLRFFVETVGEVTARSRHRGSAIRSSGGHVVLAGPTTLLLYKAYGVSGGVLFPIHQKLNGTQQRERFRFGVNVSYFFWNR
jgi:hypothetical protein